MHTMTNLTRRPAHPSLAIAAFLAGWIAVPAVLSGATATALVSATVLGPAQTDIASGAVSMSRAGDLEFDSVASFASRNLAVASRTKAIYRLQGGQHADYRVQVPERVLLFNGPSSIPAGFHTGSRPFGLDGNGAATVSLGATVAIPAGQAPGTYRGSYPLTVAYD
jgi:hypothetical protein